MTATAATLRERAAADQLAADALALVIDSGLDAAAIRRVVMADVFRRGLDDHDVHAACTPELVARATLIPIGDPHRGEVT